MLGTWFNHFRVHLSKHESSHNKRTAEFLQPFRADQVQGPPQIQTLASSTDLGSSFVFWEQRLCISVYLCTVREERGSSGSSQALPPLLLLLQLLDLLLLRQGISLTLLPALLLTLLLSLILLNGGCLWSLLCTQ